MFILSIILGVFMTVVGFSSMFTPLMTYSIMPWLIAISVMVEGITGFVFWMRNRKEKKAGWLLVSAVLSVVLSGILLSDILIQAAVELIYAQIFAGWITVTGILTIVEAIRKKKIRNAAESASSDTASVRYWWVSLILGILLVICGVDGIFNPIGIMITLGMLMSISIAIAGMNMIALAFACRE